MAENTERTMDSMSDAVDTSVQEGAAAVEAQTAETTEATPEQLPEGNIGLDEEGNIVLPEAGYKEFDEYTPEAAAEDEQPEEVDQSTEDDGELSIDDILGETQAAAQNQYTPNEFADALRNDSVDTNRLDPQMRAFYDKAAEVLQAQQQQAQQPTTRILPQKTPEGFHQIQTPRGIVVLRPPVKPTVTDFKAFQKASADVACRELLKIDAADFDIHDPEHAAAQKIASDRIMGYANDKYAADAQKFAAIHRQADQILAQQQRQEHIHNQMGTLQSEMERDYPDIKNIDKAFYDKWMGGLPAGDSDKVARIVQSGDVNKLRSLVKRIYSDYKKEIGGGARPAQRKAPTAANRNAQKKVASPPPHVEGSKGSGRGSETNVVDAADLRNMTAKEQEQWLKDVAKIANKN